VGRPPYGETAPNAVLCGVAIAGYSQGYRKAIAGYSQGSRKGYRGL